MVPWYLYFQGGERLSIIFSSIYYYHYCVWYCNTMVLAVYQVPWYFALKVPIFCLSRVTTAPRRDSHSRHKGFLWSLSCGPTVPEAEHTAQTDEARLAAGQLQNGNFRSAQAAACSIASCVEACAAAALALAWALDEGLASIVTGRHASVGYLGAVCLCWPRYRLR